MPAIGVAALPATEPPEDAPVAPWEAAIEARGPVSVPPPPPPPAVTESKLEVAPMLPAVVSPPAPPAPVVTR